MDKKVEILDKNVILKIKELRNKQSELIINIGQLHLELKEMGILMESMEKDYQTITKDFKKELSILEEKFPNGEIDLNEGTITF